MLFTNGRVFVGGRFEEVDVLVEDGKISKIGKHLDDSGEIVDLHGNFLVPGFVDVHFHGAVGKDLCDGEISSIEKIAEYEISQGITSICPATMTYSEEILTPVMRSANEFVSKQNSGEYESLARFVGINMEGPYISPDKVGAQNPAYVHAGDINEFCRLQDISGGLIKLCDVAPEVTGNLEFISEITRLGVKASIAHTCADYDEAVIAIAAGARQMTHLFNAMNPIHHRDPGPIVAAWEHKEVMAELISDGIHSHSAIIRLAFEMFKNRIVLISDTMRAVGLEDGTYDLGGQDVTVKGSLATIEGGAIAGSVTNLFNCAKHAHINCGIALEDVIFAASTNPARAIGIDNIVGSIKCGLAADMLVIDGNFELLNVYKDGNKTK